MKFGRIYLIDGIPADEFYKENATDLDFYLNGDFELMSCNRDSDNQSDLPDLFDRAGVVSGVYMGL
jgi:hypothetical protein